MIQFFILYKKEHYQPETLHYLYVYIHFRKIIPCKKSGLRIISWVSLTCTVYCVRNLTSNGNRPTKQKLKNVVDFSIKCNGHTVDSSEKVKYLGVYIDKFLNGEFIVESIVKKGE